MLVLAALCVPLVNAQDASDEDAALAAHEPNDAAQARAFFEIGAQAYEVGDYAAALAAFQEAYARARRPGLLFSIAQTYRRMFFTTQQADALARAIEHYRKYLATGDRVRRAEAERALEQLVPLSGRDQARQGELSRDTKAGGKLMIASSTPGAVLRVDGELAPRLPYVAEVAPGTHKLTLSAPGFRTHERELPVPEGTAFGLDLALEELPGTLTLRGEAQTQVWVDGRLVGALPLPPLTLKAGPHQISGLKSGHRPATDNIKIERGGSRQWALRLVHTTQRDLAIGLLWGGCAAVLASVVTVVFAFERQSHAAELERRRTEGTATASDLDDFNSSLTARDRLRDATIGLAGVGLASLLLGAALFIFDNAEVPPLLDRSSGPGRPAPKALPTELIAGPSWEPGRIGLRARGSF